MSMGGRAMELEGGAATDTGLARGAQDRGPEAKVESKALLCITACVWKIKGRLEKQRREGRCHRNNAQQLRPEYRFFTPTS